MVEENLSNLCEQSFKVVIGAVKREVHDQVTIQANIDYAV